MGQVWLAEDTRLGRRVAVKVLPAQFAVDPDRLQRFDQEARAAAALNHANIAAIHDVGADTVEGSSTPTHYMVQEHLEGRNTRAAGVPWPSADEASAGHRRRDRRGAQGGPPRRRGASRPQARERLRAAGRSRQGARLRSGQADRDHADLRRAFDVADGDHGRADPGHRRLHVARAGARRGGGRARRPVRPRLRALRDDHGAARVCRQQRARDPQPHPHREAGAGARGPAAGPLATAVDAGQAAGQGSRAALPERRRRRRGSASTGHRPRSGCSPSIEAGRRCSPVPRVRARRSSLRTVARSPSDPAVRSSASPSRAACPCWWAPSRSGRRA